MAQYTGSAPRSFTNDLRAAQQGTNEVGYTLDIAQYITQFGAVPSSGTNIGLVKLPAGTFFDPQNCRVHIDTAFNGTTPTLAVFCVPQDTQTIDGTAIIPTTAITATTTGIYRGTDANFKSAGRASRLPVDCVLILQFGAGAADATVGQAKVFITYSHDLDPTAYWTSQG